MMKDESFESFEIFVTQNKYPKTQFRLSILVGNIIRYAIAKIIQNIPLKRMKFEPIY